MSIMEIDFSREIPIFPLPNVVLLPAAVQALHIFEPRYREMTADALAGANLIAMALIQPGWEVLHEGLPPIHPVVCLARIVGDEKLDDGKFNLMLQGILRATVRQERKHGLYRVARLAPLLDLPVDAGREAIARAAIAELFIHGAFSEHDLAQGVRNLLSHRVPVAHVADILAFVFLQDIRAKQRLLEEPDPNARADAVVGVLAELARVGETDTRPQRPWPPTVGEN